MRHVSENRHPGLYMSPADCAEHFPLVGMHVHRRSDLAEGAPAFPSSARSKLVGELVLRGMGHLWRISRVNEVTARRDDMHLCTYGCRDLPQLFNVADAARVDDATDAFLGGCTELLAHQIDVFRIATRH